MVKEIVFKLVDQTKQTIVFDEEPMECMIVVFPRYRRNTGKEYLGGAHGTFGVL